jgi:hypothetical protein
MPGRAHQFRGHKGLHPRPVHGHIMSRPAAAPRGSGRDSPGEPVRRMKSAETVVHLEARREERREEEALSPLYGVAMLRIALELKRPGSGALDDIIRRVVARMGLEEAPLRASLESNGGLLRSIAPQED